MCSSVNTADPSSHHHGNVSLTFKQANSLAIQPPLLFFFFSFRSCGKDEVPRKYVFWEILANMLDKETAWQLPSDNFFFFYKITGLDRCFHSSPPWNQLLLVLLTSLYKSTVYSYERLTTGFNKIRWAAHMGSLPAPHLKWEEKSFSQDGFLDCSLGM